MIGAACACAFGVGLWVGAAIIVTFNKPKGPRPA